MKLLSPDDSRLALSRARFAAIAWLGVLVCLLSSCAPEKRSPSTATAQPPVSPTATLPCEQELIRPQIVEIQPAEPSVGSEVRVIGSGGYIQDTCGGYIEGAREFILYLDHEPIGDLSCYVNRCEGILTLPITLSAGTHCFSVEAGACEFEFEVVAQ